MTELKVKIKKKLKLVEGRLVAFTIEWTIQAQITHGLGKENKIIHYELLEKKIPRCCWLYL